MTVPGSLDGKTIVLGVTGSIAAFKAVILARRLIERGATVLPVLTAGASRFVGAVTFSGITGQKVATDMWDPEFAGEMHVALAERADLVVVAPTTADLLARAATGRADDLLAALVLCARGPVLLAPAMHPRMWDHPAVRANVASLRAHGRVDLLGPSSGAVASGESGLGRMVEPEEIVRAIEARLASSPGPVPAPPLSSPASMPASALPPATVQFHDLSGYRLVISAGPTQEAIDPVRFLGNRSSGKMGFALATRAVARGAKVTLVAGPVSQTTPAGVTRIDVTAALEMKAALESAMPGADALIMAAAVADFRPVQASAIKWKKGHAPQALQLVENPDVLAGLGEARGEARRPVLVGFALETGDREHVIAEARGKRARKKVDLIVANAAHIALGGDDTEVFLVDETEATAVGHMSKSDSADAILDRTVQLLKQSAS
jgi:phosphopantothenoylcysteine decarboxylase/phosphopantothenate--cysteine ligase